jgi:hypothetical protein
MPVEPGPHLPRAEHRGGDVEAGLGLGLDRLEVLVEAVAQHPELQRVEDPVDRLPVPPAPLGLGRGDRQLEVGDEPVDLVVAQHVGQVCAQAVADLALDLVHVGDHGVEVTVRLQPLGGRLLAHARHPGEVVAGLADHRGDRPVVLRPHAVPRGHRGHVHAGELGDPPLRVEDGHAVADELERVAVAGADQHLHALRPALLGEGGDDVVRLVPLLLQHRDAQRLEDLLDEADLPVEVRR